MVILRDHTEKVGDTEIAKCILSSTIPRGRIIRSMTRARTASNGLGTPPPLDRWIEAVLMLCVSLVQGVGATLRMIFNRRGRDWHTETAHEDLPQATSGIHLQKEPNPTHGVILGLVPRISVGSSRGLSIDPREAINQDAWHTAERDTVGVATSRMEADPLVRVPCGGRGPALREAQTSTSRARSALTRADQTPACAGDAVERTAFKTA